MSTRLLSLVVPTYNRANYLSSLLASVATELHANTALQTDIEVVVSDNASIDNTKDMCSEWKSRYPDVLVYRRNESNMGGPANLVLGIKHARGQYCMFIGDDDRLAEGALTEATIFLRSHTGIALCIFAHPGFLATPLAASKRGTSVILPMMEAARQAFFCSGIPAGSAIRGDLAREVIEKYGTKQLAEIIWPQTVIGFLAAYLSGDAQLIAIRYGALGRV